MKNKKVDINEKNIKASHSLKQRLKKNHLADILND